MKITRVLVVDPRLNGQFENPYVKIVVDDAVEEQGDPIYSKGGQYRVIPCGPFFAVEVIVGNRWDDLADVDGTLIRAVNTLGIIDFQLAPVSVLTPDGRVPLYMTVPRLRRLLRNKTDRQYHLVLDEAVALQGGLDWRLETTNPACYGGATPNEDHCPLPVADEVVFRSTHIPVCAKHKAVYSELFRAQRTGK